MTVQMRCAETALHLAGKFANVGRVTHALFPAVKFVSALRRCAVVGATVIALTGAHAQTQETRMDEILRVDRDKTSEFAGKSFASSVTYGGKKANVQAFAFSHSAVLRSGDGSFQTRAFAGKESFQTRTFATKADRASTSESFAERDKGFATKSLAVKTDRAANKSAAVHDYLPAQKSIVIRGKRQETLDEIREQKDLSIDEVREILNKPNGRPGAHPAVDTLPVMRALPVQATPNAR